MKFFKNIALITLLCAMSSLNAAVSRITKMVNTNIGKASAKIALAYKQTNSKDAITKLRDSGIVQGLYDSSNRYEENEERINTLVAQLNQKYGRTLAKGSISTKDAVVKIWSELSNVTNNMEKEISDIINRKLADLKQGYNKNKFVTALIDSNVVQDVRRQLKAPIEHGGLSSRSRNIVNILTKKLSSLFGEKIKGEDMPMKDIVQMIWQEY